MNPKKRKLKGEVQKLKGELESAREELILNKQGYVALSNDQDRLKSAHRSSEMAWEGKLQGAKEREGAVNAVLAEREASLKLLEDALAKARERAGEREKAEE